MPTRIADDYPFINDRMKRIQQDQKVLQYQVPVGVTIVREPPRTAPKGLCYVLQVDTGRLTMVLRRDMDPDLRLMDDFLAHLRLYFPSAKARTPIELVLSVDDAFMLAHQLRRLAQ